MRKLLFLLLAALLLTGTALADEIPAQVQAMLEDYHGARYATDYLEFALPDGRRAGIAVTEGSSLEGFICNDGQWSYTLMSFVMDELRPAHLERAAHDPLTYHLANADNTARLTYRCEGEEFRLIGWVLPGSEPVTVDGDVFTYGTGDTAAEIIIPGGLWSDHPFSADDLPLTLEKAMARSIITEQNVAEMFPGYTLRGYTSYNDGDMADAVYSRIEGSVLHIRRAGLTAGYEPQVVDCIPVPLSESLLARLETEPFDDLISCWLGGNTFRTPDAFSREAFPLPANAVILKSRVEEHSLVALAEEDGVRRLYVFEQGTYPVRVTNPLPADASLDFFHAGSGDLEFEWDEQNMSASFVRREDGQWLLSWCTCYGPSADVHFSANAFGISYHDEEYDKLMRVGTLAASDLFTVDFADLTGAAPTLDQSGWAVVHNPDPADRLHLRTEPEKSARSLGKFYNGTPVKVLGKTSSWTKVQVGFGPTARTGWMMTRYLAFGADMDKVQPAFPELIFREQYEYQNWNSFWVAGVYEDATPDEYILLRHDGQVMYVPQAWLFGGYG
ncbi:MAG: SH3 domain-containing protein [Clostridia bacterium]|nr:SH3 domain-containing protein [Clostridia bacterium]